MCAFNMISININNRVSIKKQSRGRLRMKTDTNRLQFSICTSAPNTQFFGTYRLFTKRLHQHAVTQGLHLQ